MENTLYKYFLLIIGSTQVIIALLEIVSPLRAFLMWKNWVLNRYFSVHGVALIFVGLPLTVYKGYLSFVIFYIGLVVVFSGPFILIYPEKIQKVFIDSGNMFNDKEIKIMIYTDAILRLSIGVIFLVSLWKTFIS